jgi:hypothetical protein
MEQPSVDFPICKIEDGDVVFKPLERTYSNVNEVINSGYTGTTDWVDGNADDIADDWDVSFSTPIILDSTGEYGFEGRAQGALFTSTATQITSTSSALYKNKEYYYDFEYYIADGVEDITFQLGIGASTIVETITPTIGSRVRVTGIFYNTYDVTPTGKFSFVITSTGIEADRLVYIDKVLIAELNEPTDVYFNYLKQPNTPYFDWYYDANDRIIGLSESETYTLQTGERYIDKDDGTVLTSGSVIGSKSAGNDADNKTVEMEIPDDEKRGVFYNILSKTGVSIDQGDATQYSMMMEGKELTK